MCAAWTDSLSADTEHKDFSHPLKITLDSARNTQNSSQQQGINRKRCFKQSTKEGEKGANQRRKKKVQDNIKSTKHLQLYYIANLASFPSNIKHNGEK